jgi:uncharacterized alkaline shock family protein YloU
VEGQSSISTDILARYAADAAGEVIGVRGLSESAIPGRRGGVRVSSDDAGVRVALHLVVDWGASVPAVGRQVQEQVREYLLRMADVEPTSVDVVVEEIGPRQ